MLALSRLFSLGSLSSLAAVGCRRAFAVASCCSSSSSSATNSSLWSRQIECRPQIRLHQLLKPQPQPALPVFVNRCFAHLSALTASLIPTSCQRVPVRSIYWRQGRLDITHRRRRMKRHQLKKFRKRCAAVLTAQRRLRDAKKEAEFREQLHEVKLRSFGWDPAQRIQARLRLARRAGYHADLLAPVEMKAPGATTAAGVGRKS